jgi:hypothetical protein
MSQGLTFVDRINFLRPPGPDVSADPVDLQALANVATIVNGMSDRGREAAFALIVDQTGAQEDYRRYLAVAGTIGVVVGAGLVGAAVYFFGKKR